MENIGLLFSLVIVVFLLTITAKMFISDFKRSRIRKRVLGSGTLVEAQVIGVAPGDSNSSSWARLKIRYIHPYTKQQTI